MKIPIFEEIKLPESIPQNLEDVLEFVEENSIGEIPTYIRLDGYTRAEIEIFLSYLENVFKIKNIDPYLPMPFIIITPEPLKNNFFYCEKNLTGLPAHFVEKIKKTRKKDTILLKKNEILFDKMTNTPVSDKLEIIKDHKNNFREIAQTTKEMAFLEKILSGNIKNE